MVWLSVFVLILFFSVYAIIHSLLASFVVKDWARRVFGSSADGWYRLAYNILAVILLAPIFPMLALLPDQMLYIVPSPWRWLMILGQLLAVAGLAGALLQTGPFHFLGLTQFVADKPTESGSLTVDGFYGWVRHPLYFFSMLFLWLTPYMTVNLLTVFVLFTIYFYIGSIYEEKRLLKEFGEVYREYRRHVPRLIPRPGRRHISAGLAEREELAGIKGNSNQ